MVEGFGNFGSYRTQHLPPPHLSPKSYLDPQNAQNYECSDSLSNYFEYLGGFDTTLEGSGIEHLTSNLLSPELTPSLIHRTDPKP